MQHPDELHAFAKGIMASKMAEKRRKLWRGGDVSNKDEEEDVTHYHVSSGEPGTKDQYEDEDPMEFMAEGGEVYGPKLPDAPSAPVSGPSEKEDDSDDEQKAAKKKALVSGLGHAWDDMAHMSEGGDVMPKDKTMQVQAMETDEQKDAKKRSIASAFGGGNKFAHGGKVSFAGALKKRMRGY